MALGPGTALLVLAVLFRAALLPRCSAAAVVLLLAAALLAAETLGLNIAGVDMLQSKRGPLILEVNSSPGLEGIEKATKQDIASKIIEYVEELVNKKRKKLKKASGH